MTKYYLSSTATSPAVTDPSVLANSPTGAGDFSLHTPGKLVTSPTGPTTTTLSGSIGNAGVVGMVWATEAGVPGLTQFLTGGWTLHFKVTALSGTGGSPASVLLGARILRLNSNNEVVESGGTIIHTETINNAAAEFFPKVCILDIGPHAFSSGSSTDRLGVQVYIQDNGAQTSTTVFSVETDSAATYLTNEISLRSLESFDYVAQSGKNAGSTCVLVPGVGETGCGAPISNLFGTIPPSQQSGQSVWGTAGYDLVTGWSGVGHALDNPNNVAFVLQNSNTADTWVVGFHAKLDDFAAVSQLISFGTSSPGRDISADVNTSGKVELYRGGAGAGAGTLFSTSNETLTAASDFQVEVAIYKHDTAGTLDIRINGTSLTWDTAFTDTNAACAAVFWKSTKLRLDDVYVYAGNTSGYAESDRLASTARLPLIKTLLPVSQGGQHDWERFSGTTGSAGVDPPTSDGAGDTTNWSYLDDSENDSPCSYVQSEFTNDQDSWTLAGLTSTEAGEIVAFLTSFCMVGENVVNVSHEVWLSGTAYQIDDLSQFADGMYGPTNTGAQWHYTCRHWNLNPATQASWAVSSFAALEVGVNSLSNIDAKISQARGIVLYYAPQAAAAEGLYTLAQTGVDL